MALPYKYMQLNFYLVNVGYLFVDLQIESFILSILVKIIFIKYRLEHMGDYRL